MQMRNPDVKTLIGRVRWLAVLVTAMCVWAITEIVFFEDKWEMCIVIVGSAIALALLGKTYE